MNSIEDIRQNTERACVSVEYAAETIFLSTAPCGEVGIPTIILDLKKTGCDFSVQTIYLFIVKKINLSNILFQLNL